LNFEVNRLSVILSLFTKISFLSQGFKKK
jgi:hypothetical protein